MVVSCCPIAYPAGRVVCASARPRENLWLHCSRVLFVVLLFYEAECTTILERERYIQSAPVISGWVVFLKLFVFMCTKYAVRGRIYLLLLLL